MRVVFMGTPEFAVPTLEALCSNHDVVAVITQPDRPAGRGKKLVAPPVKEVALTYSIPVYQFEKINSEEAKVVFNTLKPEVIVVVAYGQLLKPWLLELPKYGCLNVHASILPRWRGAAPIHWAVLSGDQESGVTIMQMDVGLDTGDMLLKKPVQITDTMTTGDLHDILKDEGAFGLIEVLEQLETGSIKPQKQDDAHSTYAKMLNREMAQIDWTRPVSEIFHAIRGFNPWPVAYTTLHGERIKCFKASIYRLEQELETSPTQKPGTILEIKEEGLVVLTAQGCLLLEEIQPPNGKRMTIKSYLAGHTLSPGLVLGQVNE
jgi:methionyl-tRNA formyltransferase